MKSKLADKRCKPCEGGVAPLSRTQAAGLSEQLTGWQLSADGREIAQDFRFPDFHHTMAFVNALAWVAHVEDHHPDLEVGYGHCLVRYTTHAIGGLSENDFICAAKIDALLESS
jgi:4a-hydroxytetrahydrobiopterin dehydratase